MKPLLLTLALAAVGVQAAEHTQLPVHVHGVTQLHIALDGKWLEIELISPAFNLVGFEHMPGNDSEGEKVRGTLQRLRHADAFLVINQAAECSRLEASAETPLADDDHQEHGDPHERPEHDVEAHAHADFHAHYRYQCASPEMLTSLKADLFTHFPLIEEMHVQVVSPTIQREVRLYPGTTNIPLQ